MIPFAKTDPITLTVERLTAGPMVARAEAMFAERIGRPAVAVSSCAAALYMAIKLSGVTEIVIPPMTHRAIVDAARMAGIRYSFGVGNTSVHLVGIADRRPVLIEDAATGLGVKNVGKYGEFACFSFHPSKELTCGEGGMLVLDDPKSAMRMRSFQGEFGFNFRMTEMQAAVLVGQLERFDEIMRARRRNHALYRSILGETQPSTYCYRWLGGAQEKRDLQAALSFLVETKVHYPPLSPEAKPLYDCALDLPVGPHLNEGDIVHICHKVQECELRW